MSWARPGVECVCVNAAGWRRGPGLGLLTWLRLRLLGLPFFGGRYVVLAVGESPSSGVAIRLRGFGEAWFSVSKFRPLNKQSIEQDIALFTPLLDPRHPKVVDDAPQVPA